MQSHLAQERRDASPSFRGQQGPDRRRQIAHRGIQANAPGRIALRSRFSAIRPAPSIYERHHEWDIERFFNKIKHFRRIATRYDKLAENFLAALKLAAIRIWLR
jgi:Transposase DDE domain